MSPGRISMFSDERRVVRVVFVVMVEGRRRTVILLPGESGWEDRAWRTGRPSSPAPRTRIEGFEDRVGDGAEDEGEEEGDMALEAYVQQWGKYEEIKR